MSNENLIEFMNNYLLPLEQYKNYMARGFIYYLLMLRKQLRRRQSLRSDTRRLRVLEVHASDDALPVEGVLLTPVGAVVPLVLEGGALSCVLLLVIIWWPEDLISISVVFVIDRAFSVDYGKSLQYKNQNFFWGRWSTKYFQTVKVIRSFHPRLSTPIANKILGIALLMCSFSTMHQIGYRSVITRGSSIDNETNNFNSLSLASIRKVI